MRGAGLEPCCTHISLSSKLCNEPDEVLGINCVATAGKMTSVSLAPSRRMPPVTVLSEPVRFHLDPQKSIAPRDWWPIGPAALWVSKIICENIIKTYS